MTAWDEETKKPTGAARAAAAVDPAAAEPEIENPPGAGDPAGRPIGTTDEGVPREPGSVTFRTVSPVSDFEVQGHRITQEGTVVSGDRVALVRNAALEAGVTLEEA